jgi:hypothetical protein
MRVGADSRGLPIRDGDGVVADHALPASAAASRGTGSWPQHVPKLRRVLRPAMQRLFPKLDRHGIHLLPKNYYSPVPDLTWLREHRAAWQRPISVRGVTGWDLDRHLAWLAATCAPFVRDLTPPSAIHLDVTYLPVDLVTLYCTVRRIRPQTVLEIGSGYSTSVIAAAAEAQAAAGYDHPLIRAIDPTPNRHVRALRRVELVRKPAQEVEDEIFDTIGPGDLVFIDGTHALKTGSELHRLYLEVIPRLPADVTIGIHDIFLPYLFQRSAGRTYLDSQETSLVLALLINNSSLRADCSMSALFYERPDDLAEVFPDFRPQPHGNGVVEPHQGHLDFPSSLWLTTT